MIVPTYEVTDMSYLGFNTLLDAMADNALRSLPPGITETDIGVLKAVSAAQVAKNPLTTDWPKTEEDWNNLG